jgi:hypothetical protein
MLPSRAAIVSGAQYASEVGGGTSTAIFYQAGTLGGDASQGAAVYATDGAPYRGGMPRRLGQTVPRGEWEDWNIWSSNVLAGPRYMSNFAHAEGDYATWEHAWHARDIAALARAKTRTGDRGEAREWKRKGVQDCRYANEPHKVKADARRIKRTGPRAGVRLSQGESRRAMRSHLRDRAERDKPFLTTLCATGEMPLRHVDPHAGRKGGPSLRARGTGRPSGGI